jgi:putative membrane protein
MMWGFYGGGWWWMLVGSVMMIIFWGAIIWLIVWGIRQFTGDRRGESASRETPLEIAQKRLARGEITREEFEELRKVLQ